MNHSKTISKQKRYKEKYQEYIQQSHKRNCQTHIKWYIVCRKAANITPTNEVKLEVDK